MTSPLIKEIQRIEPLLNESMKFNPVSGDSPELWMTLHDSVCGFATGILATVIKERRGDKLQRMLSTLKDPSLFPYHETHVILRDPDGNTIDPSYAQFYRAVGLTTYNARLQPPLAKLYPERSIAVIRSGDEGIFGEWFAADALLRVRPAQREMAEQIRDSLQSPSDQLWHKDRTADVTLEHARETLAGIWLPHHYRPIDDDRLDSYASHAIDFILDRLGNENPPHER